MNVSGNWCCLLIQQINTKGNQANSAYFCLPLMGKLIAGNHILLYFLFILCKQRWNTKKKEELQ